MIIILVMHALAQFMQYIFFAKGSFMHFVFIISIRRSCDIFYKSHQVQVRKRRRRGEQRKRVKG
jgi:hypothetical protein